MPTITVNPFADRTFENILAEMFAQLPATGPGGQPLDISVGSYIYDSLSPAAAAIAEAYIRGNLLLQYTFVDTSYGQFLDAIVTEHGLTRLAAQKAAGTITVTGVQGTLIPISSQFGTLADAAGNTQVFQTTAAATIQPRRGNGTFQETDTAITYVGTWATDATTKFSSTIADTATVYFNGTSLVTRFITGPTKGKVGWSLDGGGETIVDLYAVGVGTIDITITPAAGNHFVVFAVRAKNASSTGNTVNLDFFTVAGATTGQILDSVSVAVTALNGGTAGNVGSGTVTRLVSPLTGITAITNTNAMAGGTNLENDADLKTRFKLFVSNPPGAGNIADYKRWAKEASPLVGSADVLPLWNGNGTVKVFILDNNNNPAGAGLVATVQAYIDPAPAGTGTGKAPIGATVTVVAPTVATIDVTVTLTLLAGYDPTTVKNGITTAITAYINTLPIAGTVRYNDIANAIHDVGGVQDYSALLIRKNAVAFAATNIVLAAGEKAVFNSAVYS